MTPLSKLAMAGAATALLGCSSPRAEDPHSVLRSYSRALDEGRAEDAYRMLSEEARRGVDAGGPRGNCALAAPVDQKSADASPSAAPKKPGVSKAKPAPAPSHGALR